jgi:hypothetical protein
VSDSEAIRKAENFCQKHGIHPGYRMMDKRDGLCEFSRIGGTGRLICHPVGEPDMQSSWAMTPEDFEKHYLT